MSGLPQDYKYQAALPCCVNCGHCEVDYYSHSHMFYCEKHETTVDEVGVCGDFE